jgi:SAM-dependent methyltransferase
MDWDLRARENAYYYIDCGHGRSEDEFWRSGEEDAARLILRGIELSADARVLEIGCGIGRLLRPLARRAQYVIGVDISGEMIRRARVALADLSNVQLLQTDGDLDSIDEGSLDYVFSFIVFQHIVSKSAVLGYFGETTRVLRPGGLFRFQADGRRSKGVRNPNSWSGVRFDVLELTDALASNGFATLEVLSPNTQYMWLTAQKRSQAGGSRRAAQFHAKEWNRAELAALIARLGHDPQREMEEVLAGRGTLKDLASGFFQAKGELAPGEYVKQAYEAILGRPADLAGLEFYSGEIREGIDRDNVIDCLLGSPEFDERYRKFVGQPGRVQPG